MPERKPQIPQPLPVSVKPRIQVLSRRLTAALNDAMKWEEQCYLRDEQIAGLRAQVEDLRAKLAPTDAAPPPGPADPDAPGSS